MGLSRNVEYNFDGKMMENGVELIGIGAPHDWTSQDIISLLVG
jgi:hypothetical protein